MKEEKEVRKRCVTIRQDEKIKVTMHQKDETRSFALSSHNDKC